MAANVHNGHRNLICSILLLPMCGCDYSFVPVEPSKIISGDGTIAGKDGFSFTLGRQTPKRQGDIHFEDFNFYLAVPSRPPNASRERVSGSGTSRDRWPQLNRVRHTWLRASFVQEGEPTINSLSRHPPSVTGPS